jgi:hypothetical protein
MVSSFKNILITYFPQPNINITDIQGKREVTCTTFVKEDQGTRSLLGSGEQIMGKQARRGRAAAV